MRAADRFKSHELSALPRSLLSPAVARNRDPILAVLRRHLPAQAPCWRSRAAPASMRRYFAPQFPHLAWQPTDVDPDALASIEAHRAAANAPNLRAPIALDVTAPAWPVTRRRRRLDQHDPHFAVGGGAGLMAGAARLLAAGGVLYLYGPFKENGEHTAPSNAAFDASLRAAIRNGACATPATSARSPTATVSISSSASRCRRTI